MAFIRSTKPSRCWKLNSISRSRFACLPSFPRFYPPLACFEQTDLCSFIFQIYRVIGLHGGSRLQADKMIHGKRCWWSVSYRECQLKMMAVWPFSAWVHVLYVCHNKRAGDTIWAIHFCSIGDGEPKVTWLCDSFISLLVPDIFSFFGSWPISNRQHQKMSIRIGIAMVQSSSSSVLYILFVFLIVVMLDVVCEALGTLGSSKQWCEMQQASTSTTTNSNNLDKWTNFVIKFCEQLYKQLNKFEWQKFSHSISPCTSRKKKNKT